MNVMSRDKVEKALQKPNGSEALMQQAELAFPAAWELFCEGSPQAAAFLYRCARRKAFCDQLNEKLGQERAALAASLQGKNPKLRKNAARLAGGLGVAADDAALIEALKKEETRFVRPSMLLALGALGTRDAEAFLKSYKVPAAESEAERPHESEEQAALETALRSYAEIGRHAFKGLCAPAQVILRTPDKLAGSLLYELSALEIPVLDSGSDYVRVSTTDLQGLFAARSFSEALILLLRGVAADPKNVALRIKQPMEALLTSSHEKAEGEEQRFGYRIELRGEDIDRGAFSRELARLLDGEVLVNSPNDYEAELRLTLRPGGGMNAYLKLTTLKDERFSYRLEALPASMHPATAAAVLRYAREYLHPGARVLDPCCGSGTFLIERGKLNETASLTGVDIAGRAVEIARKNAEAANCPAKFVTNDLLRFSAERPYDEVIANLPFGNRVGSHKQNVTLYAGLLDSLPRWLKRGGTALLYTMEFTLLKKLVRERNNLKLVTESRTDAGGLMPGIFIIQTK